MTNSTSPTMAVSIDLQPILVENVGYKIGINVGFGPDKAQVPFEFDTGGPGFWSAYDGATPSWWPQNNTNSNDPIQLKYASGIQYKAFPVSQSLYFKASSTSIGGHDLTDALIELAPIQVAQIQAASGGSIKDWQSDVNQKNPPKPPLYSNFYGDFGVVIKKPDSADPTTDDTETAKSITSVLTQATVASVNNQAIQNGYPISNAYIIDIGPYPDSNKKTLPSGSLKMGLIGAAPQSWSSIPMNSEGAIQCTLKLIKDNKVVYTCDSIPVLLDTGTPTTHLWTGDQLLQTALDNFSSDHKTLDCGLTFELTYGVTGTTPITLMSFVTGTESGKNIVKFSPGGKGSSTYKGLVNTGLQPFFGKQIMFDFSQKDQSYLRFAPSA